MATILTNRWQEVFARSYQSIKNSLLKRMRTQLPEVTDQSEGNIFVILIDMFASIAEVIHYYIDNMARETFFSTAKRYSSLIKHSRLVDYNIKAAIPASVDLKLTYDEAETANPLELIIPENTVFTDSSGIEFISVKKTTFYKDAYFCLVPCQQKNHVGPINIGSLTSGNSIIYLDEYTEDFYVEGSCLLTLNNEAWELVETFAYSKPTDKHYKVNLTDSQRPYIEFGNGRFGAIPNDNSVVTVEYDITKGTQGNVGEDTITTSEYSGEEDWENIFITNPFAATGGSNYEDFDMLKEHVPLHVRTLGVAITKRDWEDTAKLAPGVDKARVEVECGKPIKVYISPDGGGEAAQALLDSTYKYMYNKVPLNIDYEIYPIKESYIYLEVEVTGIRSVKSGNIQIKINSTLLSLFGHVNSDINKVIHLSDIYQAIMSTGVIDHAVILKLYLTDSEGNIIYGNEDSCPMDIEVTNNTIPILYEKNLIIDIKEIV